MPTRKMTTFVSVIMTAAMLWSSFGTSILSAPVALAIDNQFIDDAAMADIVADTTSDVPVQNDQKPVFNPSAPSDGGNQPNSFGGWYYEPGAAAWGNWSYRDAHNVEDAAALGYTGAGVTVAVADTGIDFIAQNLQGKYMVDKTTYNVTNLSVVGASVPLQDNVSLPNSKIQTGTLKIWVNGTLVTSGFTANLVAGEIDFTNPLPTGSSVVCSYSYQPYYDWPVAFDAFGLPQYLLSKEAIYGNGGVANTSMNGTGPFDIDHKLKVDGKKDFLGTEFVGSDSYDDIKTPGSATGTEFDLTELWATRDSEFWYTGIRTRYGEMNRTFGFSYDFDGPATGSTVDPQGNYLDFEASHTAPIEQVSYNSAKGMIASCAASGYDPAITNANEKNSVKVWNNDGTLLRTMPNEMQPVTSVIWSPNGNYLAFQTATDIVLYDTATWKEYLRLTHSTTAGGIAGPNYREAMAFSSDGSKLVAGSLKSSEILVLNVVAKTSATYPAANQVRAVAFSPDGSQIALGLSGGIIQILDSVTYAEDMSFIAPGLVDIDAASVETLAWNPGGTQIAVGRSDRPMVDIWDLTIGDNRFQWGGESSIIMNTQFYGMPQMDRLYMRAVPNEITTSGLTAYKLGNDTTGDLQLAPVMASGGVHSWGMKAWVRSISGTETPLTGVNPEAVVTRNADGYGAQLGLWTPAETPLVPTDSIVIRIYQGHDVANPDTLVAEFITPQLNSTRLNSTQWEISYFTRRSSVPGAIQTRLVGHSDTVNAINWTATNIISAGSDGKVIFWNSATFALVTTRNSRYNKPIMSMSKDGATGNLFLGTADCTVRKYAPAWTGYTAFVNHKPDIMIYINYEREYYSYETGSQKLDVFDHIDDPIVYRWNQTTSSWLETNITNIFGKAFYKGDLAGEWTQQGFIEIALPRNFTAWPNQNNMYVNSFICGNFASRPQDTVPSDCNVPSDSINVATVDWTGTQITTLSAWAEVNIPKVTVNNTALQGKSGTYHFGYHPSTALSNLYGALIPIVVTESTTAGTWDKVYVDMNLDYVIDSKDPCVYKGAPELYVDTMKINGTSAIPGQDGIPDISGGLLYFIGDGKTKMPYSDRMSEILMDSGDQLEPFTAAENPMPIPKNGEIVAFFGDLDYDEYEGKMQTHGTQVASAIAADGLNVGEFGPIKGVSPDVTFLPICNAQYDLSYALYFAVEGYDATPNTGDEAQIVSVGQYFNGYGSGFDETSQLIEFLVNATQSKAVFISPAGNDGSGYGTIAAPCGANTLVVGYAEDNTFVPSGGNVHHQGAVSELSSRGPTAAGLPKPDVIALGMGSVDMPLGASGSVQTSVGGRLQFANWKSSDLASAVTTGVMALIFEAYKEKYGTFPSTETAMKIIRSSSKDLGYDPLTQGAGFVDALAAVNLARAVSGLTVEAEKTSWGDTFGVSYDSFINVVAPGGEDSIAMSVNNPLAGSQTAQYNFDYMTRINLSEYYQLVPSKVPPNGYRGDISHLVPPEAEMIKVTAQTEYAWYEMWANGTGADFKTFLNQEGSFLMNLWDWVDSQPVGDPKHGVIDVDDDLSFLTGSDYGGVNSLICTLSKPHQSLTGSLVVEIAQAATSGIKDRVWKISVESFASTPMSWVSLDKASAAIAGGGTDTVNVNVDVPADAMAGTYAGSFVASYAPSAKTWANSSVMPGVLPEADYLFISLETTAWDDGSQGNHWDNWVGPDGNTDGIVDNPYSFLTDGKMDNKPLVNPVATYSNAQTAVAPITITDNTQFATFATYGNGTAGNPWLIENLIIDGSSYPQPGISISGTTDYFIIRNCDVFSSQDSGIFLNNVINGAVFDSEFYSNTFAGVQITSSTNLLLDGINIHDNSGNGIYMDTSSYVYINNAIVTQNFICGIYVGYSTYITVSGSVIHDQVPDMGPLSFGIYFEYSDYCLITGNNIYNEVYGLYMLSCTNNEISWNLFENFDGTSWTFSIILDSTSDPGVPSQYNDVFSNDFTACVAVHAADDDPATMNTWDGNYWEEYTDVDSEPDGIWDNPYTAIDNDWDGIADLDDSVPLVDPIAEVKDYRTARGPIQISGDGDFILANGVIDGTGTAADPYIISGWSIDTTSQTHGISIQNTDAYFVIMNCRVYGTAPLGINLVNTPNGTVRSNMISEVGTGIYVQDTTIYYVYLNDISVTGTGIQVLDSPDGEVMFNIVNGGQRGLLMENCPYCTVGYNYMDTQSVSGIEIVDALTVEITENTVANCAGDGILLSQSDDCTLTMNTLDSNGYGIHLSNATGFNYVNHNNLLGNTVQAYDDFVGDTVSTFELFSDFGVPADYVSTYDVWFCNVSRDGVNLTYGADYTVNFDTGLVTFTPAQTGRSGGAEVLITAVLLLEEDVPALIKLPNIRLTDGAVNVNVTIHQRDGTTAWINSAVCTVYRKVGVIELNSTFRMQRGVTFSVTYTYYTKTCIVPLTLNVITSVTADFKFGSMTTNETPNIMPVWGVRAGQGTTVQSGDRRYFYVDVPNQGMFGITELANFYLYTELSWALYDSDINIVVYGKGDTPISTKVAPYTMTKLGGSEEKADFSPLTATGGPKDILVTPFNHEVLTICVSSKAFNGAGEAINAFEGQGGWLRLSDNNPKTWSNSLVGHAGISFSSSIELSGVYASIVGPAQGTKSTEEIYQDDLSQFDLSTLEGWLTMNAVAGFTKVFTVENALSWDVHISGHAECPDLDLAVFLDGLNGQPIDGIAQWQEIITKKDIQFDAYLSSYGSGTYAYCADADADEAIKFISPPNGDYIVKVLGYTVNTAPGFFDLEVKSIFAGVEGYKLSHAETEYIDEDTASGAYLNNTPVRPFEDRSFDVLWAFPEETADNIYGGIFVLGVPEFQKLIVLSMDINLDRQAPDLIPGFTGPNSIVSTATPTISVKIEDLIKGEIDPDGAYVEFDGQDITNIATISIGVTANSADIDGYWTGDIIYKPLSPLTEGGHFISVEAKDKAGNARTISWGFTVDTTDPSLVLSDNSDVLYTRFANYELTGSTEKNSVVSVIGVENTVKQHLDNTFTINLDLEEGSNYIALKSTDMAGNVHERPINVVLDTEAPTFNRLVALDGSNTNKRVTGIYGEMSEAGTLTVNNAPVLVNSDGTFSYESLELVEGRNMNVLTFTDMAGNVANGYINITLDTAAPTLIVANSDNTVTSEWLNITGTTESDVASLTINGKLVDVANSGGFQNSVRLSPGNNIIVIESKDRAGNAAQEILTINYDASGGGANIAAISVMIVLLILGLLVGMFLGGKLLGGPKPEPVEEIEPTEEGLEEPAMPEEQFSEVEDIEAAPEAEPVDETGMPEEPAPEPLPEIPAEESLPEELPPEPESEVLPPEPAPVEEDPRIVKLTEAYESGKISKELYEKNLAKFKGQ